MQIKILFICHGNICRSPMAELIFKKIASDRGLQDKYIVDSKATSTEEIGASIYPPAKRMLEKKNIPILSHYASQITKADYNYYDYLICMDEANIYNTKRITGGDNLNKIHLLLEYAHINRSVADPWYTDDFETAYNDIVSGVKAFLSYLEENGRR